MKDGYHGYRFKILKAQGKSAPGGARSYVNGGGMTEGFALVGWPARYGETGLMTFIVNHDGVVYEKYLGPDTANLVGAMTNSTPMPPGGRFRLTDCDPAACQGGCSSLLPHSCRL